MASRHEPADIPARHEDQALGFTIPGRHARGRVVRLGPTLDAILANHGYPPVLERLLAEALVVTALLGSLLKDAGGQLTLQAQTNGGAVDLLVCDYRGGEMRGYVRHEPDKLAELPAEPSLFALFGKGHLAITFDQAASGERYQGIVPLEGGSLAEAVESYFAQSEQLPSMVRVAFARRGEAGHVAGGIVLQHLPEGEEGRERLHTRLDHPEWEHVAALGTRRSAADGACSTRRWRSTAIVWRLFHDEGEVRVLPLVPLARGCRCSVEHIRDVIGRFPADEHVPGWRMPTVSIRVDCAFCARAVPDSRR